MKILYIPSSYGQIYTTFDLTIERTLIKMGMDVLTVSAYEQNFMNKLTAFQPDIVFTMVGFKLRENVTKLLRKKGILSAVWLTEDPYFIDETIKLIDHYDVVFTIDLAALRIYQSTGHPHVYNLPLGTDPEIYFPTEVEEKYKSDLCLVGYPYPSRVQLIKKLLSETDCKITVIGNNWDVHLHSYDSNRLNIIPKWLTPSTVNYYFNGAKINLNTHRPFQFKKNKNKRKVLPLSINNRTFDLACSRSFQLIDFKEDLYKQFRKTDIVHFKNNDHLLELVNHFLTKKTERDYYAANGYDTVLQKHTFSHRMETFIQIMKQM